MSEELPIFILDNGAYSIKAGWAHQQDIKLVYTLRLKAILIVSCRTFPNGIFRSKQDKKTYTADQLDLLCEDFSGLVYKLPFERVRTQPLSP